MVSIEDFVKFMLRKWKLAVGVVLICTLVFAGASKLLYRTVTKDASYLIDYYRAQVELYEDILENPDSENSDKLFFEDELTNKRLLTHFREQLLIAPREYMEHVTIKSAVVFGGLVGGILAVSTAFALYKKESKGECE